MNGWNKGMKNVTVFMTDQDNKTFVYKFGEENKSIVVELTSEADYEDIFDGTLYPTKSDLTGRSFTLKLKY
jgi:hypothetical protein